MFVWRSTCKFLEDSFSLDVYHSLFIIRFQAERSTPVQSHCCQSVFAIPHSNF
jgi:hypothetical protein